MKQTYKLWLLFILIFLLVSKSYGQGEHKSIRIGIDYGIGTQQIFPFNDPDYAYYVRGYKGLVNFTLRKPGKFSYELQLEPGIYLGRHTLLNASFVTPDFGPDYMQQREIFTKETTITEYAANVGLQVRYKLKNNISIFILGGTGPMYSDTATERLARGFAFSDVFAFGVTYKVGRIMFELRPGIRHVSNLNTQFPNSGHNSSNIDFILSFQI
jgi:hypothetical protein